MWYLHLDTCDKTYMSDHFVKQWTHTSHSKTANATCIRDAIPSVVWVGTAAAEDNCSFWTPLGHSRRCQFSSHLSGCMYISPHMLVNCPDVLRYAPSSISMGCFCNISWHANFQHFPTWSLHQKRMASTSSRWKVFSNRNRILLNHASEYMFLLFMCMHTMSK